MVHNSFNFVIGLVYGYRWLCCGSGLQLPVVLLLVWFIDTALVLLLVWFIVTVGLALHLHYAKASIFIAILYSLYYLGIWTSFFFSDDLSVQNSLHREIKHIQTTTAFKTAMKTHLFKPTTASNSPPPPPLFSFLSFSVVVVVMVVVVVVCARARARVRAFVLSRAFVYV